MNTAQEKSESLFGEFLDYTTKQCRGEEKGMVDKSQI